MLRKVVEKLNSDSHRKMNSKSVAVTEVIEVLEKCSSKSFTNSRHKIKLPQ